jgi:hypothetical protein
MLSINAMPPPCMYKTEKEIEEKRNSAAKHRLFLFPTSNRKKIPRRRDNRSRYTLPCYDLSLAEQPMTRVANAIHKNNKNRKEEIR